MLNDEYKTIKTEGEELTPLIGVVPLASGLDRFILVNHQP